METTTARKWIAASSKAPHWVLALAAIVLGLAFLLPAMRLGVGISPDSAVYLGVARNLAAGKGFTVPFGNQIDGPLTQFPPFYPIVLAVPGLLGSSPLTAAWLLQALLYAANIAAVFITIRQVSGKPRVANLAAAGVLALGLSPSFLMVHQMAWAESLFILLVLLSILNISAYLKAPRLGLLFAGAALAGLATLTRFAGAAFIAALAAGIFLWEPGSLSRRLVRSLVFAAASMLLPGAWLLHNLFQAGAATSREFALHPPVFEHFKQLTNTLSSWVLVPETLPLAVKIGLLLAAAAGWVLLARRVSAAPGFSWKENQTAGLLGISVLSYGLFILVSLTFMDANIPLDGRILFPVMVCFGALTFGLMAKGIPARTAAFQITVVLMFVFGAAALWQNYQWARNLYFSGNNFNNPRFVDQQVIEWVRAMPDGMTVYSNSPEAVFIQTGKPALGLPRKLNLMTQQENENFAHYMTGMGKEMTRNEAVIVYYAWVKGKTLPTEEEISQYIPLQALLQTDAGAIYTVKPMGD